MFKRKVFSVALLVVFLVVSTIAVQAAPPEPIGPVEVSDAVYSDVSGPISDLTGVAPAAPDEKEKKEKPIYRLPNMGNALHQIDDAEQTTAGPFATTTSGLNFAGVGQGDYGFTDQFAPPDTVGAVGTTQYVQWVNDHFAVFDKVTGAIVLGPIPGNTPWVGLGGGCELNNDGDPIVQYDKIANRWILTQFSVSTLPYLQCVAVSLTSDATGAYYRYAFSYGNTQFNDYPKLGVWPDGYYISYNIFNNAQTFAGSKVCAFDRTAMLVGNPATQQCFQLSNSFGGLLPSDLDGASSTLGGPESTSSTGLPPTGTPNFFMSFGANSLNLWKFHVDFATPANSTFSGPTNIPVAAFNAACSGGGACIPQPGTSNKLDSLADRLMYRLAYRNRLGSESLLVNHSVSVGTNKKNRITSVRWYEVDVSATNAMSTVYQQGTLSTSDGIHRWMGSIASDKQGNIALGYSASSGAVKPSIRYTGRLAVDPRNSMQAESIIKAGGGSQFWNLHRWGDYSAMTVDPVDDCTFWFTTEYLKENGSFNWSTQIASFKFPACN